MNDARIPNFGFTPPRGYFVLLDRKMVNFEPFGVLRPWYYLDNKNLLFIKEKWPHGPAKETLVAFARRQDSDEIACFEVSGENAIAVVVINGWTTNGYAILSKYTDFWLWFKSVVDDIAEVSENEVDVAGERRLGTDNLS
jgi:hypothetical protein